MQANYLKNICSAHCTRKDISFLIMRSNSVPIRAHLLKSVSGEFQVNGSDESEQDTFVSLYIGVERF